MYLPESGGNNYPLRGGKYSQFEGGIRSTAFVSGGFLPEAVRGTQQSGMISIADWYATFSTLAGVDPFDEWAAESGLPPVDGLSISVFTVDTLRLECLAVTQRTERNITSC